MAQSIEDRGDRRDPLLAGHPEHVEYRSRCDLKGAYASIYDLDLISVPENAASDFSTEVKEVWLRISARRLDSMVGQRWSVPLKTWSDAWVWANTEVAYAGMMGKRGHDPEAKTERTVADRMEAALAWVRAAQDYEVTVDPRLVLHEPSLVGTVHSSIPRGWSGYSRRDFLLHGHGGRRRGGFFRG